MLFIAAQYDLYRPHARYVNFKDFRILVISYGHKKDDRATVIMHPVEIKCYLSTLHKLRAELEKISLLPCLWIHGSLRVQEYRD